MTRAEANRFLDRVRTGQLQAPTTAIDAALRVTGDLIDDQQPRSAPLVPTVVASHLNRGTRVMREAA